MKYTIQDFRRDFPDDGACLQFLFHVRFGDAFTCPKCKRQARYYRVKKRKSYACCRCGFQIYPTANTIFHKSSTDLTLWFYAIFLMSKSKHGVSAKMLERQLGVTYKCAHRMRRQIQLLMQNGGWEFGQAELRDDPSLAQPNFAAGALLAAQAQQGGAGHPDTTPKKRHPAKE